jgi:two-component system cell cycle response regulator DivK
MRILARIAQGQHVPPFRTVRAIKVTPGLDDIPVIAFTAYAMAGDEQRFLAAGCDGYLAKPIDVRSFAASVRQYL